MLVSKTSKGGLFLVYSGLKPEISPKWSPVCQEARPCEKRDIVSSTAFEVTSKRRRGFPSETRVKRGERLVHGDKELNEKLGRKDLCPCGSGRSFQAMLS